MAATVQNNTSAQIGKRLADGEQAQKIAAEFGMTETSFSRSRSQYYEAYILSLQTELNAAKTAATQLQGVNNGLQKSCDKLQATVTELQTNASTTTVTAEQLQVMETNLHEVTRRLQQSETNLQVVSERLQAKASQLQVMETERNQIASDLQVIETERDRLVIKLQAVTVERDGLVTDLQAGRKSIAEQHVLTHPRFLLWAIIGFEGYNAWQLFSNMQLQMFPFVMAMVFALFFGLASVTALAANHRWGVWVCVASAFVSNAIHANLFVAPSLAGGFYTLLPCVLVYLFADMYKNKNNS